MMKYSLSIILMILLADLSRAQSNFVRQRLTTADKKYYLLKVDAKQIRSDKKTEARFNDKKHSYVTIKVALSNNSADTLKYLNMTCSWDDAFTTSNKAIKIEGWACDSNFPTVYAIPPGVSKIFIITLEVPKEQPINNFRVGFYLIKYRGYSGFRDFVKFLQSKKSYENCILWSNEIPFSRINASRQIYEVLKTSQIFNVIQPLQLIQLIQLIQPPPMTNVN